MFKGKTALVTGSTSGIGLGIAAALAARGSNVVLNGFGDAGEIEKLRAKLAAEHGVKVRYDGADLSQQDAIESMMGNAIDPALRLRVGPSCRLISSAFPVLRIWQVNQPDHRGDMRVDFNSPREHLRIRREPDGIALQPLGAGEFTWLGAVMDGVVLAAAIELAQDADAAFDLGTALHRFIGDGTITGIDVR